MNGSAICGDGQLTTLRVEAAPRELGRGQRSPSTIEARQALVDPVVQLSRRQRPVPLDQPDPDRVGRDPPERHGLVDAIEDALDLAQPVLRHLGKVGEHLARPPAGLVGIVEDDRHRPRRAGFHRGPRRGEALAGGAESFEQGLVHAPSVAREA